MEKTQIHYKEKLITIETPDYNVTIKMDQWKVAIAVSYITLIFSSFNNYNVLVNIYKILSKQTKIKI